MQFLDVGLSYGRCLYYPLSYSWIFPRRGEPAIRLTLLLAKGCDVYLSTLNKRRTYVRSLNYLQSVAFSSFSFSSYWLFSPFFFPFFFLIVSCARAVSLESLQDKCPGIYFANLTKRNDERESN